eukprot:32411-Eustigmatos_ZCMA.PRE.1
MFYVGMTRTKKRENIRLMLVHDEQSFVYSNALSTDPAIEQWLDGFNEEGFWDADLAKYIRCLKAQRKRKRASQPDCDSASDPDADTASDTMHHVGPTQQIYEI